MSARGDPQFLEAAQGLYEVASGAFLKLDLTEPYLQANFRAGSIQLERALKAGSPSIELAISTLETCQSQAYKSQEPDFLKRVDEQLGVANRHRESTSHDRIPSCPQAGANSAGGLAGVDASEIAGPDDAVSQSPTGPPRDRGASSHQDGVVRVFISSTFADMHLERDILAKHTFPALRAKYRERGVEVLGVDLRWGIPPETESDAEMLRLCLGEVQKCQPYFIGLLGERYGWVPQEPVAQLASTSGSVPDLSLIHI